MWLSDGGGHPQVVLLGFLSRGNTKEKAKWFAGDKGTSKGGDTRKRPNPP